MRILLTVKHFDYGGGQNHVRELANALAVRGHRVWVAAPPGRQAALLHRSVEHVPVSYSDLNHPFQAIRLARLVVATLHGQLQHDLTRWPGAPRMLARLIVVSPFFADLVASLSPVLAPKTVCIPNGARRAAAAATRDEGRQVVVCAARVVPRMGAFLTDLANAAGDLAREHPAFELHIYGDGPALPALLVRVAEANRAAGRAVVRLSGYHPDLPLAFAAADLALGVGRVAIEALMQGVPLIPVNQRYLGRPLSRQGYSALAATNFVPRHSPPPDRAALRRALADALEHLPGLAREARELRPLVARDHDIDVMAGRIEEVYLALVPAPRDAADRAAESAARERPVG